MPRRQLELDLRAIVLAAPNRQTPPLVTEDPETYEVEDQTTVPSPPPQTQPEPRPAKRPRTRSPGREGRGTERAERGKAPENSPQQFWEPTFRIRGKPIPLEASLQDSPRLAVELSSALLLPTDVDAVKGMDRRKLARSAIHQHALGLQRSYIALSTLEEELKNADATKEQNAELLQELNKRQIALMEAEDAKRAAEIARQEAEDKTLAVKSHTAEVEQLLSEKERKLAEREQELADLKLQQQEKEDQAYNDGLDSASKCYLDQIMGARAALFERGWTSALKKAGIQEDSGLFVVENPFEEPAEVPASPTVPLSPSSLLAAGYNEQEPPPPLE